MFYIPIKSNWNASYANANCHYLHLKIEKYGEFQLFLPTFSNWLERETLNLLGGEQEIWLIRME